MSFVSLVDIDERKFWIFSLNTRSARLLFAVKNFRDSINRTPMKVPDRNVSVLYISAHIWEGRRNVRGVGLILLKFGETEVAEVQADKEYGIADNNIHHVDNV